MKLLKLIPDETKIPFTKYRWHALALTLLALFGSIVAMVEPGFNFGVDFRGGITIEVADEEPVNLQQVREVVGALNVGSYKVQRIGDENTVLVFVELSAAKTATGSDAKASDAVPAPGESEPVSSDADAERLQQIVSERVQTALKAALGDDIEFRRIDVVGPTVSGELVQRGVMAVVLATAMMLVYIWIRFQWQWGTGAVLGVIHDTTITLGIYAVCQFEFSLATIAAILTVIGYSVNDTVVVYDRIRENLRKYKKMPLAELIDLSLNETLTRTIVTGGTTIMALFALVIFGGEVLRGFSVAITLGIVIGTYSSLFVAAPFLLLTGVKRDWSKVKATATA